MTLIQKAAKPMRTLVIVTSYTMYERLKLLQKHLRTSLKKIVSECEVLVDPEIDDMIHAFDRSAESLAAAESVAFRIRAHNEELKQLIVAYERQIDYLEEENALLHKQLADSDDA